MALYAFDGTWNDSTAPDEQRDVRKDTNVHRFRIAYNGQREYVNGVGTRFGLIGKIVGGLTGAGAEQRISELFDALKQNFAAGDTDIDVVGYSRGAAIARMFVQRIERDFDSLKNSAGIVLTRVPQVRFLGLFDTVASFGIPWTANEGEFNADIPECVTNAFHAMALDETRETFGIERCVGNRSKITEVWFRGSHGDIGGNATYVKKQGEVSNRQRSDIALNWMLAKAKACGVPVSGTLDDTLATEDDAPVTSRSEPISIGNVGTLSRRIHIGDLVHHTLEQTHLTRGIDGRMLRRITVPTRIENRDLEKSNVALTWVVPEGESGPDNVRVSSSNPSIVELSSRRYPFDILPARTWKSWLEHWKLENPGITEDRLLEFWAPQEADRGLAWDLYVELITRITTQSLDDSEGDNQTALESVYTLFRMSREYMHLHGVRSANTAALLTAYLNQKVRGFTAKWHKRSLNEKWKETPNQPHPEFRNDLKALQPVLRQLADALSHLADARL
jgi:Uncharacterized alpha/beta hydrolase domain (DUF2235)